VLKVVADFAAVISFDAVVDNELINFCRDGFISGLFFFFLI